MNIDALVASLLDDPAKAKDLQAALDVTGVNKKLFIPNAGPQTEAYFSKADILLYGGSPGGGKTALEIGLALNEHHRTLLVRKEFVDLDAPIHTLENILRGAGVGSNGLVRGNRPKYRKKDSGEIVFMGVGDSFDGKQGLPFDLLCFDEGAQLSEDFVRMCLGWLRSDRQGQRKRVVIASNPPLNSVGDWLIDFFPCWLDKRYPNPAAEGELRYFNPQTNEECSKDDVFYINGIETGAQSRTFISSKFSDNPYYDAQEYAKSLAALPAKVRERLISGDFMLAREDDEWQVIPTEWIEAAFDRWETQGRNPHAPMCAMGIDVAQSGGDKTVLAMRYDGWYDHLVSVKGDKTPTGAEISGLVIQHRKDNALVVVDNGGGFGGATVEHLKSNGFRVEAHNGGNKSLARTKDRTAGFYNKRAEVYWRFREALDPTQDGGSHIMLPRDPELLADLTAVRIDQSEMIASKGIKLVPKKDLVKQLGRSPDKGDAVVMAWAYGQTVANIRGGWEAQATRRNTPTVVNKHAEKRRLSGRK